MSYTKTRSSSETVGRKKAGRSDPGGLFLCGWRDTAPNANGVRIVIGDGDARYDLSSHTHPEHCCFIGAMHVPRFDGTEPVPSPLVAATQIACRLVGADKFSVSIDQQRQAPQSIERIIYRQVWCNVRKGRKKTWAIFVERHGVATANVVLQSQHVRRCGRFCHDLCPPDTAHTSVTNALRHFSQNEVVDAGRSQSAIVERDLHDWRVFVLCQNGTADFFRRHSVQRGPLQPVLRACGNRRKYHRCQYRYLPDHARRVCRPVDIVKQATATPDTKSRARRSMLMDGPFFDFHPYHILLAGCGLVIVLAYWFPRFLSGREPAASGLLILGGLLTFGVLPGVPEAFDPLERPGFWQYASEFAVIIALFGTGLRIDRVTGKGKWTPTIRLLAVAMPLCILAVVFVGLGAGLTLAGAVLLAAVLAPTDPVLAADVQVGPPLEGGEHPVRLALTTEAGLNDGLAFPFVYLAIFIVAATGGVGEWIGKWFGLYVVYKIAIGTVAGIAAGWVLGRLLFVLPAKNPLAKSGTGVIALAGVLLTYGATELVEGYGFIAAFVMGLVLRRAEADHEYHTRLHSFSEALEHAVTAVLLVLIGGTIPVLLPYLDWPHALLGLALIFLIRPISGMIALAGTDLTLKQRGVVSFFGVRGLGSIYYMAYAGAQLDLADEGPLWATVVFTILVSTIVHGATAGSMVKLAEDDSERRKRVNAIPPAA